MIQKDLKLFVSNTLNDAGFKPTNPSDYYTSIDNIIEFINKNFISKEEINIRLEQLIGSDNETLKIKRVGEEGKIAAAASKNAFILAKEMLVK